MAEEPGAKGGYPRVSTGLPALDTILNGGLVGHRPYLIVGPSGTGKTTLALQFLIDGVRRGERTLVVTLEEPPNEMRINHRGLGPDLEKVYVFDAIPDVMRYERAPFKDIAAVRESVPFSLVATEIRKTPELSSVEVTFTALEQTIKMEMAKRSYTRLVIDSLTALQYFCMKGIDETLGAQSFLRFLSDLGVTTFLTVESPVEEAELPEQLLARGEIRLFRWEHDGRTVRAIGVEKFRGSTHDIRLHPYRIGPLGVDINLDVTISRDTRQIVGEPQETVLVTPSVSAEETTLSAVFGPLEQDLRDLVTVGVDVSGVRRTMTKAIEAARRGEGDVAEELAGKARGRIHELVQQYAQAIADAGTEGGKRLETSARRLLSRAADTRAGVPPTFVPEDRVVVATPASTSAIVEPGPIPAPPAPDLTLPEAPPAIAPVAPPAAVAEPAPRPTSVTAPPTAPPPAPPPPPTPAIESAVPPPPSREPPAPVAESAPPGSPPAPVAPAPTPTFTEVVRTAFSDRPALPTLRAAATAPAPAATVREPVPPAAPIPSSAPAPGPTAPTATSVEAAGRPPAPVERPAPSAAPTTEPAPPAAPGVGTTVAMKRKRRPPVSRKKSPIAVPGTPSLAGGAESAAGATAPAATGPVLVAPPKSRRRAPRKRSAPSVTSAEAGPPPPEEHRVSTPPAEKPADAPPPSTSESS